MRGAVPGSSTSCEGFYCTSQEIADLPSIGVRTAESGPLTATGLKLAKPQNRRQLSQSGLGQRRVHDGEATRALDVVHFPDSEYAA
jgi:hypothetical protein